MFGHDPDHFPNPNCYFPKYQDSFRNRLSTSNYYVGLPKPGLLQRRHRVGNFLWSDSNNWTLLLPPLIAIATIPSIIPPRVGLHVVWVGTIPSIIHTIIPSISPSIIIPSITIPSSTPFTINIIILLGWGCRSWCRLASGITNSWSAAVTNVVGIPVIRS